MSLTMTHYLGALDRYGVFARDALLDPDRGWLTDEGHAFLARQRQDGGNKT